MICCWSLWVLYILTRSWYTEFKYLHPIRWVSQFQPMFFFCHAENSNFLLHIVTVMCFLCQSQCSLTSKSVGQGAEWIWKHSSGSPPWALSVHMVRSNVTYGCQLCSHLQYCYFYLPNFFINTLWVRRLCIIESDA